MIKIKICGLKSHDDIDIANKYLPDYIGFVFAQSKRQVTAQAVSSFNINPLIKKVGVFVNEDINKICDISSICGLDIIQLHGDETQDYINKLKSKIKCDIWKAVRVKDASSLTALNEYTVDTFLVDSYTKDEYGGSGVTFNWDLLKKIKINYALAGGLNIDNVENAINQAKPKIIDVSSGVETNGIKDEEKVKQIIEKVRFLA